MFSAVRGTGAPWPVDASETFGPEHAVGKSIEVTVRGARLLVEVVADLASPWSGETELVRMQSGVPVAFLPDLHGRPSMGLGSVLALSDSTFDSV